MTAESLDIEKRILASSFPCDELLQCDNEILSQALTLKTLTHPLLRWFENLGICRI